MFALEDQSQIHSFKSSNKTNNASQIQVPVIKEHKKYNQDTRRKRNIPAKPVMKNQINKFKKYSFLFSSYQQ